MARVRQGGGPRKDYQPVGFRQRVRGPAAVGAAGAPSHVDSGRMLTVRPVTSATSPPPAVRRAARLGWCLGLLLLLVTLAGTCMGMVTPPPARAAVSKGLIDVQLEAEPAESTARAGMIREIDRGLGARWVRVVVDWSRLEPTRGAYAPAELARLDALVGDLHAAGVKVILTTCYLPGWATDRYWWSHPPGGYAQGPQVFYPIRDGALKDYRDLAEFLARRYKGKAQALECWNEPNLWPYIYPQRTANDPYFAARVYLRMLKAFHAGVARAHTGVRVVAGATAPVGLDDSYRTSPQRFARFLSRAHAGRYFDVYSHHPYTPGGVDLHRARPAAQRPFAHGDALQPAHATAPLPQQALLPHGIRLQHAAQPHLRRVRRRGGPGTLPDGSVPLRHALPAGEAARVVPGP